MAEPQRDRRGYKPCAIKSSLQSLNVSEVGGSDRYPFVDERLTGSLMTDNRAKLFAGILLS